MCDKGDTLQSISGLMVVSDETCLEVNGRMELNFISIEPFVEWIEEVSAGNMITKVSSLLLMSVTLAVKLI
jgi:hypothetical protein